MKRIAASATILIVTLAAGAIAQDDTLPRAVIEAYSFDLTGGGARAEGMGKAYIGLSDEISGVSWNPAGIYDIDEPVMAMSYGRLAPRGSSTSSILTNLRELDHSGSFDNLTSLDFAAPVRIKGHKFVGSFSYARNFDHYEATGLGFVQDILYITNDLQLDTVTQRISAVSEIQGGLSTLNFGFGTRFYENVSFGVALNVFIGKTQRATAVAIAADSVPITVIPPYYVRQLITENVLDSNSFSGINATVGFKLNREKVGLGIVARVPLSSLKSETDRRTYTLLQEAAPEVGVLRPKEELTRFDDNLLAKYRLPVMVAAGVAFKPSPKSVITFDGEFRAFSGTKIDLRDFIRLDPGGTSEEFFTEVDPGWKNAFAFRGGGEYLWETGIGTVPLRAGAGFVQLPAPSVEFSLDTSLAIIGEDRSQDAMVNLSLGTGIHWAQIRFDLAYTYSTYSTKMSEVIGGFALSQQEFKNRNHHLNFTFTGYF